MTKARFYAVIRGRKPGIYTVWGGPDGAESQISGYRGAVYKGFVTRADAEQWYSAVSAPGQSPGVELGENPDPAAALAAGKIVIYTDGAAIGNPGPGGYGAVLLYGPHRKELSGGFARTTNNRMELMACIAALQAIKVAKPILLLTDSEYVVEGFTGGIGRGWRKNADLWRHFGALCDDLDIDIIWVKGHAGNPENERCHALSFQAASGKDLAIDGGFVEETKW